MPAAHASLKRRIVAGTLALLTVVPSGLLAAEPEPAPPYPPPPPPVVRRVLGARLAFRLGRRLAPALVVRWRIWVDRVGRVVGVGVGVVVREERVEEKAAVDEEARVGMEERTMPDEAVPAKRAVMGEPPPLRVGRGGEAERQGEGDDDQCALHRDSSCPRGGGGGGASTPPFAP